MFLYMAYQNVHQPQQVPEVYEQQYEFIENSQRRALAGETIWHYTSLVPGITLTIDH